MFTCRCRKRVGRIQVNRKPLITPFHFLWSPEWCCYAAGNVGKKAFTFLTTYISVRHVHTAGRGFNLHAQHQLPELQLSGCQTGLLLTESHRCIQELMNCLAPIFARRCLKGDSQPALCLGSSLQASTELQYILVDLTSVSSVLRPE